MRQIKENLRKLLVHMTHVKVLPLKETVKNALTNNFFVPQSYQMMLAYIP